MTAYAPLEAIGCDICGEMVLTEGPVDKPHDGKHNMHGMQEPQDGTGRGHAGAETASMWNAGPGVSRCTPTYGREPDP